MTQLVKNSDENIDSNIHKKLSQSKLKMLCVAVRSTRALIWSFVFKQVTKFTSFHFVPVLKFIYAFCLTFVY